MTAGEARGWIGHKSVNLSVRSNEGMTNVRGWVGNYSVNVNNEKGDIDGTIKTAEGWQDLSLSVKQTADGSRTSGSVGPDSFHLTANLENEKEQELFGRLGPTGIHLWRRDHTNGSFVTGWLNTDGASQERVRLTMTGSVPQAMEAIYPALSFLGPSVLRSVAGISSCDE